ncbi:glycoside hydrolase family 85 protein [Calocera cornea HHB12733]|uniref:Glycoside hydrolase family 85 protein n=1 Tax=Calocera cornea HHB12733 TaxID=1353952 RepID=A0A165HC36_9BASI|nr:glycoside hydrolase family 85 protein [Calocera cornea HHB12733]
MPGTAPTAGKLVVDDPFPDHPAYFVNLSTFESYMTTPRRSHPPPAIPLRPRAASSDARSKLVVCHDMAGNYVKDEHDPMWTMAWWGMADVFIYFSHYRVGPPPRTWINAGHRQGCKVLGVLIFEPGNGEDDQYRLFQDEHGKLETKYAKYLVDLCEQRGFDGWLINLELRFYQHVKHLREWLAYLTKESRDRLGHSRSCIMWYDSITTWGWRSHQNTLTAQNAPFFLASDMLHTNYWYDPKKIKAAEECLAKSDGGGRPATDIAFGIDVWGRGTYKDGGYKSCLAIDDIRRVTPQGRNFSTSLFGPAYLWECGELYSGEGQSRTRESWWERESLFWIGRISEEEQWRDLRILNTDKTKQFQSGDVYHPMTHYFPFKPQDLPLSTTFSLGAGTFFNVNGQPVRDMSPWSDHCLVSPLPDLALPYSLAVVQAGNLEISLKCDIIDRPDLVWFGAHSLQITLPPHDGSAKYFIPLFSAYCGIHREDEECIVAEVIWTTGDDSAAGRNVLEWSTSTSYRPEQADCVALPTNDSGIRWKRTASVFYNLVSVVRFGITVSLDELDSPSLVLGAISIRRASRDPTPLVSARPYAPHFYCENLQFTFAYRRDEREGLLTWDTQMEYPDDFPALSTLDDETVLREVTISIVGDGGEPKQLCWATTHMDWFAFSWREVEVQELLRTAEQDGKHVEVRVGVIDAAGYRSELPPCTLTVSLLGQLILP